MTTKVKIENLGPANIYVGTVQFSETLEPGQSKECYVYAGTTIMIDEQIFARDNIQYDKASV